MNRFKKIGFIVLVFLIGMQLIQPAKNKSTTTLSSDITNVVAVPAHVQHMLSIACADCHSNNTRYPWYAELQPAGWLLAKHIRDGKAELNLNEFGSYSKRRQTSKLSSIASSLKDGSMPISSYKWLHKDARLTEQQKAVIINWANSTKDSIEMSN